MIKYSHYQLVTENPVLLPRVEASVFWCKDCMKKCNVCKSKKPFNDFYRQTKAKDGYAYTCKLCLKAYKKPSKYNSNYWFGGLRETILEKDGYKCLKCGMTRKEHRDRWNRDLTVDHINGKGRNVPANEKDNRKSNLQTLCLSCHGKKDILKHPRIKLNPSMVKQIRKAFKPRIVTYKMLSKKYGVSTQQICRVVTNKEWKSK